MKKSREFDGTHTHPASPVNRVALFTNEYPPNIYGGAGVHVDYLSKALSRRVDVEVRCFGEQISSDSGLSVHGYSAWEEMNENTDGRFAGTMGALSTNLAMAKDTLQADVVHCHTWYAQFAGILARQLWDVPLVVTVHSLEPLRPWKEEQLGNAYRLSSWIERTAIESADAVIAVSAETKNDIEKHFPAAAGSTHIIHNGIDLEEYKPTYDPDVLKRYGIDPSKPYVLFVGRVTRQKGIIHLVEAIPSIDPEIQVVLLAGAPDTPGIAAEMNAAVAAAREQRPGIFWIKEMVDVPEKVVFYSHAEVFCCPSVYEPFGIINLEAMACETAVVSSAVGGIPEVVEDGTTGLLVDPDLADETFTPSDAPEYSRKLARAINRVAGDPDLAGSFGRAGRERAVRSFSWQSIAEQTLDLYNRVAARGSNVHD